MKYPTNIVNDDYGWHRIHQGHSLDHVMLRADLIAHAGEPRDGSELAVDEVWMTYHPRVKNCSEFDGFGCDNEGEWHAHWFAAKEGHGEALTLAYWEVTTVPAAPQRSVFERDRQETSTP